MCFNGLRRASGNSESVLGHDIANSDVSTSASVTQKMPNFQCVKVLYLKTNTDWIKLTLVSLISLNE